MPTVPIEIIQVEATGEARYAVVSGRINGRIRAGIDVTAEVCHGMALGLEGGVFGTIGAQAQALFVGAALQGEVAAQAGVKAMLRVNPNPFESMGLTIEGGAYAYAAAAGRLAIYLTPEYFARFIEDNLDGLPADLFLIFLEEVRAEVGVWGKVAASTAADGHINAILSLDSENPGFEVSSGFNVGHVVGIGADYYCLAGFSDLRRMVRRSTLRIALEVAREIRRQPTPAALALTSAFDFAFPLAVMTAFDLGVIAHQKGVLLTEDDVSAVLIRNFTENLQRYTADSLLDCAVRWLVGEFRKLHHSLIGRTIADSEMTLLEARINELIGLLDGGELSIERLNRALGAAIDIADVLDQGELMRVARPLTTMWLAGMLGLRARQLLDTVGVSVGISSSLAGSDGTVISLDLLGDPPQLVLDEVSATLGQLQGSIDVGVAVDYLVEIGPGPLLARLSPEFQDFRQKLESSFGLSSGDVVEDIVRSIAGIGSLSDLASYTAFRAFVRDELLLASIRDQLLPLVRERAEAQGDETFVRYLDEVVEPCNALVVDFIFLKLDGMLLANVTTLDQAMLRALTENITAGCGAVIHKVLVFNLVFFDRIVTDFMLDQVQEGFRELRASFEVPEHPFSVRCREVLEQYLPGQPDLSGRATAQRTLLQELAGAFEEMTGPTILTPQRRQRIHELKRDILLSMSGDFRDPGPDALSALVAHLQDCAHIPDLEKVRELALLVAQIQAECFAVLIRRMLPVLAEFYLSLTLPDLVALQQQLNAWIDALRRAAEDALAAYTDLADVIRTQIVEVLDAIDTLVNTLRSSLAAHVSSSWALQAKAAVRLSAEGVVTAGITDPTARADAVSAFASRAWLLMEPMIDAASATLASAVSPLVSTLDGFVENSSDAVQSFLDWQADIEEQLLNDLQSMVVIPAADTATIIMNTIFPPYVITMIENYLEQRAEQRRLRQEETAQQAALGLLAAELDATQSRLAGHLHRSQLALSIAIPSADLTRVHPASVRLSIFATGLTDQILAEPQSRRIQLRLNGRPLDESAGRWQAIAGGHLWTWQSATGSEFVDGVNILEASWIRGTDSTRIERTAVQFRVNTRVFLPDSVLQVHIDASPPGPDVQTESVLIEWNGSHPLELKGWTIRDLAGHRYRIPENVMLVAGQRLRVFTGGSPAQNSIAPAIEEKVLHMGRRKAVWNNTGDLLELIDPNGVVAVSQAYGDFFRREA